MPLISYAQNFEDVMLWRALGHVKAGFYIDIGAQDPVVDSVSFGFYEQGWRGIHVEPTPVYAQALRDSRPDETVVQAAIGEESGLLAFFEIPGTGISTGDADIAHGHQERGFDMRRIEVPCIRLSDLLDKHCDQDIHWMKIDVEGMESSVLKSWSPSRVRPWVLVVEATLPLSTELSHTTWEDTVLILGYRFAYFDGLNRFYISDAHVELFKAFASPPNVFDGFVISGTSSTGFCSKLNNAIAKAGSDKEQLQAQNADLQIELRNARQQAGASSGLPDLERQFDERTTRLEQRTSEVLLSIRSLQAAENAQSVALLAAMQESIADEKRLVCELREALGAAQSVATVLQTDAARLRNEALTKDKAHESAMLLAAKSAEHHQAQLSSALDQARQAETRCSELLFEHQLERQLADENFGLQMAALRRELDDSRVELQADRLRHAEAIRSDLQRIAQLDIALAEKEAMANKFRFILSRLKANPVGRLAGALAGIDWRRDITAQRSSEFEGFIPGPDPASLIEAPNRDDNIRSNVDNLPMHPAQSSSPSVAAASSLDEILRYEGHQFVQCAYVTLLGREPDPDGFLFYVASLERGIAKLDVLRQLRESSEWLGMRAELPGLRAALRKVSLSRRFIVGTLVDLLCSAPLAGNTNVLDRLFTLHNEAFVDAAYLALLRRLPDIAGREFYLNQLKRGAPKWKLLAELSTSAETEANGRRLPGLDEIVRLQRRARLPIVGCLFARRGLVEGNSAVETRLRVVEQQLFAVRGDHLTRGSVE